MRCTGDLYRYSVRIHLRVYPAFLIEWVGFLNGLVLLTDRLATACPYGYGSIRLWGSVAYTIGAQVSGMIYEMLFPLAHYFIFVLSLLAMLFCLYQMRDQKTSLPKKEKIQTKTIFKHLFTNKAFLYYVLIYCLTRGLPPPRASTFHSTCRKMGLQQPWLEQLPYCFP